jgi:O-antigen ligase/tetratricopeptide (TPR) repeat protein
MKAAAELIDGWGTPVASAEGGAVGNFLLRVVDFGLIGVICVAPFFFGGRHDLGRLVLVSLIAVTSSVWFLRQAMLKEAVWPRSAAYAVLLFAAGLLVLQIVPLPVEWLNCISPGLAQRLPLWSLSGNDGADIGTWRTLSLIPHETTKSLAMLISYGLLLAVVAGRIQNVADVRRLLGWVGAAAVMMAVFGILQYLTSGGRYFYFYSHPYRSASKCLGGAFINRNHFAHFLVLGIGPLVAWLVHIVRQPDRCAASQLRRSAIRQLSGWIIATAIIVVVLASMASRSRGGAVVLVVALAVLVGIYFCKGIVDSRFLYGLVGLTAVVCAALSWHGYDRVVDRLDDLTEASIEDLDESGIRRTIWAANVAAIKSLPLVGSGAGSHREICPVYLTNSFTKEYTHAENGYLQVVTENGAAGGALLVAALGIIGWWCLKCFRRTQAAADDCWFGAAAAGLAASAVHSLVDFVWYIPACMSVTIVLAGCVLRLLQMTGASGGDQFFLRVLPRGRWLELAATTILIGAWNVHTYVGPAIASVHWGRYLRASVASSEVSDEAMAQLVSEKKLASQDARRSLSHAMLRHLEAAVYWDPQFARAHSRLADRYLAEFELGVAGAANVLEMTHIRDAAMASSFKSPDQLRSWLARAFGPDAKLLHRAQRHARRALALCPLQGEAYLRIAELAFLELGTPMVMQAYIDQGLLVRPHDRNVLIRAGRQEFLLGRYDRAVKHWSRCFNTPGRHQKEITYRFVAAGMPAREFLDNFKPNWQTLREIWTQYKLNGNPVQLNDILAYAERETRRETAEPGGTPPAYVWYRQSLMYVEAGRNQESLASLQRAYRCDPRQYSIRNALAKALQSAGNFVEAEPHLRWCIARRPSDKSLRAALENIARARLEQRKTAPPLDSRWKASVSLAKPENHTAILRR